MTALTSTTPALTSATATQLAGWYRDGSVSPVEATQAAIDVAASAGVALNAVAIMNAEQALEDAASSAARWAAGNPLSELDGVPVSVKDSFPMVGLERWHGSKLNDGAPPSVHDGAPVRRLREAGATLFAKTSMPDFGLIGAGVSSQFGIIRNPWNPELNPGGSSSGSGALVALGAGPLSVGTDMGGSVRLPAALCGLVGLKPTQGRIAYDPPKLIGSAGPMARTVADAAALLRVIGKPDLSDHLSLPGAFEWDGAVPASLAGVTVGLLLATDVPGAVDDEVAEVVRAQAALLAAHGATVVPIEEPLTTAADRESFMAVLSTRGLPELLAVPEDKWPLLPPQLLEQLLSRTDITAVQHVANEKKLDGVRAKIAAVLNSFDYVLSPVTPVVSFPAENVTPVRNDYSLDHMVFTSPYNLTSLPAGTVPVAMSSSGMPIGVQVGGRRFDDTGVLGVLALLELGRSFDLAFPYAAASGA
ncbi:amidase family protein [uncultured Microbacterium sp.]|uniref:Putative amidase n=1 Tax=uncultured Microbacterium sp. TaxID=191216 RepID=A0A1Y5PA99_9MICO|nr:amidase family protein [uncultured Microbacterium sp.]SBS73041.1 putative amidase [uncultured Microbacterium sp.]